MPNDNPLSDESHPDLVKGERFNNLSTRKRVSINGQDFNLSESSSQPRKDGVYEDVERKHIITDHAGNPLPENSNFVALSHTGLFITSQEQMAHCNYWLHPTRHSHVVLLGQDGQLTATGAICSHCASWPLTINIVILLLIIGVFGGLLKAVGVF